MSSFLVFRSITHAQRALRVLQRYGIPAGLSKAPQGITDHGCAYGLRLSARRKAAAEQVLARENIFPLKTVYLMPDGSFREADDDLS